MMGKPVRLQWLIYGVLLVLLCWLVFRVARPGREESRHKAAAGALLNLEPASYETISTTVGTASADNDGRELTWSWRYDSQKRLSEISGAGEVTTRVSYSSSKPRVDVSAGGEMRIFAYDRYGRLLSTHGSGGAVEVRYYRTGMPAEVRTEGAPDLRYTYDSQDRLIGIRIGRRITVGYSYDYLGRLAAMTTPAGLVTYRYDRAANVVMRRLPNGTQTFWQYDDEARLAGLTHVDPKGRVIAGYVYGYRPDGLIERIGEKTQSKGGREFRYRYDLMHRLTAVECQGSCPSYGYTYDRLGNLQESRTSARRILRFTSAASGALTSDSRGSSRLDSRGHIRLLPHAPEPIDYEFRPAGDLAAARHRTVRYRYNALGFLAGRIVNGRDTRYLPDPMAAEWHPLWRRNANGSESVMVWDNSSPLLEISGKAVSWRLEDHAGSVRVELDRSGAVAGWRNYTPYGTPDPAGADPSPGFAGLIWDPVARVYLATARAYDPETGRFLQPDPDIRLPGISKHSHSLYAYCGGDPVNFVDRDGAEPQPVGETHPSPFGPAAGADLRDSVVRDLIAEAWKESGKPATKPGDRSTIAHKLAKAWRDHEGTLPNNLRQIASPHEFKADENYLFARRLVDNGVPVPIARVGIGYWGRAHREGERRGNPPNDYLKRLQPFLRFIPGMQDMVLGSRDKEWLPDIPGAQEWRERGVADAAGMRDARKRAASKPLLQKIGDFLVPPAYGDEVPESDRIPVSPVGGVYLGGASAALEGLGELKGVAVDKASGKLLLIGSDQREIPLPPLRLEDVVTVFRAVYDHGEPPSVTIDPDPADPTGPVMHVKHGPGTQSTYVGWVLFECDRIMKTFHLAQDNITRRAVETHAAGYAKVIEKVFFGSADERQEAGSIWERFWIVPAAVRRLDNVSAGLSLLELPLKVNTQRMRWEGGGLKDDESGPSSPGAQAFSHWFTVHYPDIAAETYVVPPPGSGVTERVPVFQELRRIATMAAIAERLRDLGERMPPWMCEFPVRHFAIPASTPSLTRVLQRRDGSLVQAATVYGGVNLSPADKDVRAYRDARRAAAEDREFLRAMKECEAYLVPRMPGLAGFAGSAEDPGVAALQDGRFGMAALPGAETLALLSNRQTVTDIAVDAGLGRKITLTRSYDSLFDPAGEFGHGWTLDLPRLVFSRVPVKRDGKRSQFRATYDLISPLGTVDIRFSKAARVEPYGSMIVADDHPEIAGLASGTARILAANTLQLMFRDGTAWHFDGVGQLVVEEFEGTATRYVRDSNGALRQILGYVGTNVTAEIQINYDSQKRIIACSAHPAQDNAADAGASEVQYEYDAGGRLAVVRPSLRQRRVYTYKAGLLSNITGGDVELSFGYNHRGQLLWEKAGSRKLEYRLSIDSQARQFIVNTSEGDRWTYDRSVRPIAAKLSNGRVLTFKYGERHNLSETLSDPDGPTVARTVSADGNTETIASSERPSIEMSKDIAGRPLRLTRDGVLVWHASWLSDGPLEVLRMGETELRPRRHKDGWWNGLLVSAPMEAGKTREWMEAEWNVLGKLEKITDSSGVEYATTYDNQGRLRSYGRLTKDQKLVGTSVFYNDDGLVSEMSSSWERERREYTPDGVLKSLTVVRQGSSAALSFDFRGRPTARSQFDSGYTKWLYGRNGEESQPDVIELPHGERIEFRRNGASCGVIRVGPAVIRTITGANGRLAAITWGERE